MSNNNTWDLFLVKAKEVGKAVGDVACEVVDSSKLKMDELKTKKNLGDAYEQLGKLYYRSLREEIHDEEKVNSVTEEIDKLEKRLAEIRAAAKKSAPDEDVVETPCPHCGGMNRKGATFCSYCGKSME